MSCDGTRVFVLGGDLSPGAQADEAKLIHTLDTGMYCPLSFHLDSLQRRDRAPHSPEVRIRLQNRQA